MKQSQRAQILAFCDRNGSITVRDAFEQLNINSPTKRISELRKAGYSVVTKEETREKADGSTVRYLRYYIKAAEATGG